MVTEFSVLNTKTHGGFNELLIQLTKSGTMAAKCVNFFLPNTEMANLVYDFGMEKIYHHILVKKNHWPIKSKLPDPILGMSGIFLEQCSIAHRFLSPISLP